MSTKSSAVAIREEAGLADVRRFTPPAAPSLPSAAQMADLLAYGAVIAESGLFPNVTSPQAAVMIMRFGQQLGIDEFTALTEIYWINRVPVCSAKLMNALITRDHGGDAILPVESTPERCTISYKRRDWTERKQSTVTMAQFQHLKAKDNWRNHPADMLWARNVSRIARQSFADTIKGLQSREELSIEVEGRDVDDGDRVGAMRRLHAIGEARGLDHDALHRFAVGHGYASLADLSAADLVELGTEVEETGTDELAPALERERPDERVDVETGEVVQTQADPLQERTKTAIRNNVKSLGTTLDQLNDLIVAEFNIPDAADLTELDGLFLAKLLSYARQIQGAMVTSRLEKILKDMEADPESDRVIDSAWLSERFRAKEAELEAKVAAPAGGR